MLEKFKDVKVLVVGDVILDEYVYGKVERISPEAPVPILAQYKNEFRLGGAANVAANCASLGATTTLMSFVGADSAATIIQKMCEEKSVSTFFPGAKGRHTPRKIRYVSNGQQILRVDKESKGDIGEVAIDESKLIDLLKKYDVVIVSDYNKGCVNKVLMDFLKENHKLIVVDPKPVNADLYHGVKLVTPNRKEAAQILGVEVDAINNHSMEFLAFKLASDVLVTMGEDGMIYCPIDGDQISFPAVAQEIFDVTGAGDTVVAVVSLAIAVGMEMEEACRLANKAAAQVVAKFGTATVDMESLEL